MAWRRRLARRGLETGCRVTAASFHRGECAYVRLPLEHRGGLAMLGPIAQSVVA